MRVSNVLVLGSIAINVAIVVCAQFAADSMAYFRQALPYFILVALVGGLGALLDWRETRRLARSQFLREEEPKRNESNAHDSAA